MARKKNPNQNEIVKTNIEWHSFDRAEFLELINFATRTILPNLEMAIRIYLSVELDEYLIPARDIEQTLRDELVDNIAIHVLAPGTNGVSNTRQAVEDYLRKVEIEDLLDRKEFRDSNLNLKNTTAKEFCHYCHFELDQQDYLSLLIIQNESNKKPVHYHCVISSELREMFLELREVSVEIRRQIQYSKKIIDAFMTNPNRHQEGHPDHYPLNPLIGLINNNDEYINWLFHIYTTWSDLSEISKRRHIIYWSHFLSLCNFLLEYRFDAKSVEYFAKFLIRYLQEDKANSIISIYIDLSDIKVSKKNISLEIKNALKEIEANTTHKTYILKARKYTDIERQKIIDNYNSGNTVIIDSTRMADNDFTPMMDYVAGAITGTGGSVHQISNYLLMMIPPNIRVIRDR